MTLVTATNLRYQAGILIRRPILSNTLDRGQESKSRAIVLPAHHGGRGACRCGHELIILLSHPLFAEFADPCFAALGGGATFRISYATDRWINLEDAYPYVCMYICILPHVGSTYVYM